MAVDQPRARNHEQSTETIGEATGCLPAIVRLTWLMWGNVALFLCAVFIAQGDASLFFDVLFFVLAVALVGVRYMDITRLRGTTSEGEPATITHWRRYAITMVVVSLSSWGLARLIASRGWM